MQRTNRGGRRGVVAIAVLVLATIPVPSAWAAGDGTVTATVTVASPCLTLDGTAVDFGTGPFSSSAANLISLDGTPSVTIQNCSGAAQQIYGRGTDAVSPADESWLLGTACGGGQSNVYGLDAVVNTNNGPTPIALSTSDELLSATTINGGLTVDHTLHMPCAGSVGAGDTMSMTIVYTATF